MRMYDILEKKRGGQPLTDDEIAWFVAGVTADTIPDYQTSALLMAICINGMDTHETAVLTDCMAHSGEMADLSPISGIKADKHSTGGVGDKTTLLVAPIVAACGVSVAKMSGRGLGHTGGTIDKLEAIPGFCATQTRDRFFEIVRDTGLSIIGQSGNIAPADKKLYALRDVTATVDSLPLIASSIMSKKLAAGSDAILLDVKTGSGAFMKTLEDSIALAKLMVSIGEHNGRSTAALITDMDIPLGTAIGNSLEVIEAVESLHGRGPADLLSVSLQLAANMLWLAGVGDLMLCGRLARRALETGRAFEKLCAMVTAQGGDVSLLEHPGRFPCAPVTHTVCAPRGGFITRMHTQTCGAVATMLGAGRTAKTDTIDPTAGIVLCKKTREAIAPGDPLAVLHTSDPARIAAAETLLLTAFEIGDVPPKPHPLLYARVTATAVEFL